MIPTDKSKYSSILWTKDYVEHLRTVHFSLITVSVGLIIFAFSYHPQGIHTAITQLNDIMDLKTSISKYSSLTEIAAGNQKGRWSSFFRGGPNTKSQPPDRANAKSHVVVVSANRPLKFEIPIGLAIPLQDISD